MESEKITTRLDIDPTEVRTLELRPITAMQECLLCDNAREIPHGYGSYYPWVCDECKEAIAYLKTIKKRDPCEPILD